MAKKSSWSTSATASLLVHIKSYPCPTNPKRKKASQLTPFTDCLVALLELPNSEQGQIWCDDRWASSHPRAGTHPIVTTHDILHVLRKYNALSDSEYFTVLSRLRAANVRFIPPEDDEILYYLEQAPLDSAGMVEETPELAILRRYTAACLYAEPRLQPPTNENTIPNQEGELRFIVKHNSAVSHAVANAWTKTEKPLEQRIAWADWILDNLFTEYYQPLPQWVQLPKDFARFQAIWHLSLITGAILIPIEKPIGKETLQKRYFDWLYKGFLQPRLDANPALLFELDSMIGKYLLIDFWQILRKERTTPQTLNLDKAYLRQFIQVLPSPISEQLSASPRIHELLGKLDEKNISVNDYHFESKALISALSKAFKTKKSKVYTEDGKHHFTVRKENTANKQKKVTFIFKDTDSKQSFSVTAIQNTTFLPKDKALSQLKRQAHLFDLSPQSQTFIDIVNIKNTEKRFSAVHDLLSHSGVHFYQQLETRLEDGHWAKLDELLPPSSDAMLRFLRMDNNADVQTVLKHAAKQLIKDVGIKETLRRLSALPCPLPAAVHEHLATLSADKKKQIFQDWRTEIILPLEHFHFIHAAICHTAYPTEDLQKLLETFLSNPERDTLIEAFLAFLNWVKHHFDAWKETCCWHPAVRLTAAWLHSGQIMKILMSVKVSSTEFTEVLRKQSIPFRLESHLAETREGFDVADPNLIPHDFFLIQGLGFALQQANDGFITDKVREVVCQVGIQSLNDPELGDIETINTVLMRDTSTATNRLGSFLQQDIATFLQRFDDERLRDWYSHDAQKHLIDVTGSFNQNDSPELILFKLATVLPYCRIPEAYRAELTTWLLEVDLSRIWLESPRAGTLSTLYMSQIARHSGSSDFQAKIEEKLCVLAKAYHQHPDNFDSEELTVALLDACFRLAFSATEAKAFAEKLVDILTKLTDNAPEFIPNTRKAVQKVCDTLPLEQSRVLWSLALRLQTKA